MTSPVETFTTKPDLYERDYCLWLETTIQQLQRGQFADIDLDNLLEELTDMVKRERRSLESNLEIVLMHLLKYRYQPEKRSNSWRYTLLDRRDRISRLLEDSPSLKPYLERVFVKCYGKARQKAAVETGLAIDLFPEESPFEISETLNIDYLP